MKSQDYGEPAKAVLFLAFTPVEKTGYKRCAFDTVCISWVVGLLERLHIIQF